MPDIDTQAFWDELESEMWDEISLLVISIVLAGISGGTISLPKKAQPFIDFDELYAKVLEFARKSVNAFMVFLRVTSVIPRIHSKR